MDTTSTRPRGAYGVVIDPEVVERYAQINIDAPRVQLGYQPQVVVLAEDTIAVVNSEGVGNFEEGGVVGVFVDVGYSQVEVDIPLGVLACALTDEVVDLADVIRVFGPRLEANHWRWHNTVTKALGAETGEDLRDLLAGSLS